MPGLVPGIHAFFLAKTWMAGTSPAMTTLKQRAVIHRPLFFFVAAIFGRPLWPQARSEAQILRSSRNQSAGTEAPSARTRMSAAPVHWKPHFSITRRDARFVTR